MAIKDYKEIVNRKGYLVEKEDRKIFEKEISKSNFGEGYSDIIEFILYDSNDNQLPQGTDGRLVRYIHISDSNWNEYFYLPRNSNFNKNLNDSTQFFINLEKLVREAGYSNGIFKTQVTLLNRRIGSEEVDTDRMWIHEISPSRTEIRVVPIKNTSNKDLIKRYNLFTSNGNFRDDTIYYSKKFIEGIDVNSAFERFLQIKGTTSDGMNYKQLIQKEFKIDLEKLFEKVKEKYIKSMNYFIDGREWDSKQSTYGKVKTNIDKVELSVSAIINVSENCFINSIEEFLPKRNIQEENELSDDQKVSLDKLKSILKSTYSNLEIESTIPDKVNGIVRGCTDINAENYNPLAKENDGSCRYPDNPPIKVKGCTDSSAANYNKYANEDDGSCKYDTDGEIIQMVTKTYYVWSSTGSISYKDKNKNPLRVSGNEYDAIPLSHIRDSVMFVGDIREIPKIKVLPKLSFAYMIENISNISKSISNPNKGIISDNQSSESTFVGAPMNVQYKDELGNLKTTSTISVGEKILVCAEENSIVALPGLKITKMGNCGEVVLDKTPLPIRGCTNPQATNYVKEATIDDGSCKFTVIEIKTPPPVPDPTPYSGGGTIGGGGRNPEDIFEVIDRNDPRFMGGSYVNIQKPRQNIK